MTEISTSFGLFPQDSIVHNPCSLPRVCYMYCLNTEQHCISAAFSTLGLLREAFRQHFSTPRSLLDVAW